MPNEDIRSMVGSTSCTEDISRQIIGLSYGDVMVTRSGNSEDECEKLCRDEAEIECRYYKYSSVKGMCTLAAELDATIPDLKKLDDVEDKTAESWVSQLQARILALEQKDTDIKSNNPALDDKIELAEGEIKRVEDTVLSVGEMQKTMGKKIRQMNEDAKATSLTVTMLSQTSKDTRGTLREVGVSITDMRFSISNLKKSITDLQVRFAGFSADVMEKIASVDALVGPELKELRYSQMALAQALSMLTRKIMTFTPRIPELQKRMTSQEAKISVVNLQTLGLGRQISSMTEKLSFSESQIQRIIDPSSRVNAERRQILIHVQGQIESLIITQTRLQNDLIAEISERSQIYKELSALKIHRKTMFDQIMNQYEQVRQMKITVSRLMELKLPQSTFLANILSRQLSTLRSIKKISDKQDINRSNFVKYTVKNEIAQQEAMRQIKILKNTDHSLIAMQTKIFAAYRNMVVASMHDSTRQALKRLIAYYNEAASKINRMRRHQQRMTAALMQNKFIVKSASEALQMQRDQRQRDMGQIYEIKKKIAMLYKIIVSDKMMRAAFSQPDLGNRLAQMANIRVKMVNSLSQYRAALQKAQEDLKAQRIARLEDQLKNEGVIQQLEALRRSYGLLSRHEGYPVAAVAAIHNNIAEHLENKAKLDALRATASLRAAKVAEINNKLMALKNHHAQVAHINMMNDYHNAVTDEIERQAHDYAIQGNPTIGLVTVQEPEDLNGDVLDDLEYVLPDDLDDHIVNGELPNRKSRRRKSKRKRKRKKNRGRYLKRRRKERRRYKDAEDRLRSLIDDFNDSVSANLEQQSEETEIQNERLSDIDELNDGLDYLRRQQRENKELKEDIRKKQALLNYVNSHHLIYN